MICTSRAGSTANFKILPQRVFPPSIQDWHSGILLLLKKGNGWIFPGLKKFLTVKVSTVEVMEVVAVPDEFLFPVLAGIDRGPEIPDLGGLEGRTERAEGSIDIICLCPYRAIINTLDNLNFVPAGKWHSNGMTRQSLDEHAEPGKQEF